jgi:hypothetical protein
MVEWKGERLVEMSAERKVVVLAFLMVDWLAVTSVA